MTDYELVLGLEVHMQLTTASKMFCTCKNDPFNSEPNANVCPVCLGLPGAMPVPNLQAIKSAQLMAHNLGSTLNNQIIFERKNYSYPDLPKSFQLTCPHYPISTGGEIILNHLPHQPKIKWREIHLEEDTAKSVHEAHQTKLDFNKSGVPLLEMVTEPDFHSIEDAVEFCKEIQLIARYLKISEADMEKGHMRLEANISVRKKGDLDLPNYRVELKNINSFSFMKKALEHELRRQTEALINGEKLHQETRGFNESTGKTFAQRSKEDANDYRYFPEPDVPVIDVDAKWLQEITTLSIKAPQVFRLELINQKLSINNVNTLVSDNILLDKFNNLVKLNVDPIKAANLVINIAAYKDKSAEEIATLEKAKETDRLIDEIQIADFVDQAFLVNQKAVTDYKNGNEASLQFLIGQVMKLSHGKADATIVKEILAKKLS